MFTCLAAFAWAQEPWTRIYLDSAGGPYTGPALHSNGAVFQNKATRQQGNEAASEYTEVTVLATAPIAKVLCVLDAGANGAVYAAHLMGLRIDPAWLAARSEWDWAGDEAELSLDYPGPAFAPLIAHYAQPRGWLVGDIEARVEELKGPRAQGKVRTLYTRNRIALEYRFDPPLAAGQALTLRQVVTRRTASTGRAAMNALIEAWRVHVPDHHGPEELAELNGYLNVQLQDQDAPLQHVMRLWADHGKDFGRVQLWGWTSDRLDGTPRTSCCLHEGSLHPRYEGLQWLLAALTMNGTQIARYYNADDPRLDEWLQKGNEATGQQGNETALYVDVAGFRAHVRRTYGWGTIIEGATAASADGFLAAGAGNGGKSRMPGGTRTHEQPADWFGRLAFNRRAIFDGDANSSYAETTAATKFRTYRRCFLRGYKLDWRGAANPVIPMIIAEWERTSFWARRPEYRDVEGLEGVPAGAEITRFRDEAGKTLLEIDATEWPAASGQWSVTCDGQAVPRPTKALSIYEQ